MTDDRPHIPPLDDLIGRTVRMDGRDWTVRRSEVTGEIALESPIPESDRSLLLRAMREGATALVTDPVVIRASPLPDTRAGLILEWEMLDAQIAGSRLNGSLAEAQLALLEARMQDLTAALIAELPRDGGRSTP